MPIYEYVCKDCKNKFELLRSVNDADAPISCGKCRSDRTYRAISVFIAKSGSKIIAGGSNGSCSGCSGGTCSSCSSN